MTTSQNAFEISTGNAPLAKITLGPGESFVTTGPIDFRPSGIKQPDRVPLNDNESAKSIGKVPKAILKGVDAIVSGKGLVTWRYKNETDNAVDIMHSPKRRSNIVPHEIFKGEGFLGRNGAFWGAIHESVNVTTKKVPLAKSAFSLIRSFFAAGQGVTMQSVELPNLTEDHATVLFQTRGAIHKVEIPEGETGIINQTALFGFSYAAEDTISSNTGANGLPIMSYVPNNKNRLSNFFAGAGLSDIEIAGPRTAFIESKSKMDRVPTWTYALVPAAVLAGTLLQGALFKDSFFHFRGTDGTIVEVGLGNDPIRAITFDQRTQELKVLDAGDTVFLPQGCEIEDLESGRASLMGDALKLTLPRKADCLLNAQEEGVDADIIEFEGPVIPDVKPELDFAPAP